MNNVYKIDIVCKYIYMYIYIYVNTDSNKIYLLRDAKYSYVCPIATDIVQDECLGGAEEDTDVTSQLPKDRDEDLDEDDEDRDGEGREGSGSQDEVCRWMLQCIVSFFSFFSLAFLLDFFGAMQYH